MTVGEKIKTRREELKLSQEELATKVGYKSRSSIQKIENSRDLPLKKVREFAAVLDISPSYLMGWTDNPDPHPFDKFANHCDVVSIETRTELVMTAKEKELVFNYRKASDNIKQSIDILLNL